ncbi:unnamed protein product [Lactuca virosa]|uniref:Uncharacterized protein n=1 Tax=Lactuca virosa TaxID=75947 RepID=A0AAU9LTQ7_9ASTR|nr:unnamed protein product [Lactuca virosa]
MNTIIVIGCCTTATISDDGFTTTTTSDDVSTTASISDMGRKRWRTLTQKQAWLIAVLGPWTPMSSDELSASPLMSRRSGTPFKLLGREYASV